MEKEENNSQSAKTLRMRGLFCKMLLFLFFKKKGDKQTAAGACERILRQNAKCEWPHAPPRPHSCPVYSFFSSFSDSGSGSALASSSRTRGAWVRRRGLARWREWRRERGRTGVRTMAQAAAGVQRERYASSDASGGASGGVVGGARCLHACTK